MKNTLYFVCQRMFSDCVQKAFRQPKIFFCSKHNIDPKNLFYRAKHKYQGPWKFTQSPLSRRADGHHTFKHYSAPVYGPDSDNQRERIMTAYPNSHICFWCFATIQLARQVQQERTQVVCGNKEAQKHLTDSNATPAIDLGLGTNHVRRYCGMCV